MNALGVVAAAATGTVAGVFVAFSTFVMTGLGRLPTAQGLAAMQAVNRAAPTSPTFLVLLLGTAAADLWLGIGALGRLDTTGGRWQLTGAALYLTAVALTAGYHIPRNTMLDRLDAADPAAAAAWPGWRIRWTAWNHLRSVCSTLGVIALVLGVAAAANSTG